MSDKVWGQVKACIRSLYEKGYEVGRLDEMADSKDTDGVLYEVQNNYLLNTEDTQEELIQIEELITYGG